MSFDFKRDILSETENPQDYVKFEGIITDIYNAFPDMEIYNWGYDKDSKKPWMRIKAPIYKDKTLSIKILAYIQKEHKHCKRSWKHTFICAKCCLNNRIILDHRNRIVT